MKIVCAVAVLATCLSSMTSASELSGTEGRQVRVNLGGREYLFDTTVGVTWTEAKNFCRTIGMFLVSVEFEEENQFIVDFITTTAGLRHYWMSGTDLGRPEGDYIWDSTGRRVTYTDFHPGEPTFLGEHFLQYMWFNGALKWNDSTDNGQESGVYTICEQL